MSARLRLALPGGTSVELLKRAIMDNRFALLGRPFDAATPHDHYMALAYTVRDRLLERFMRSARRYKETRARTVCYFSAEYQAAIDLRTYAARFDLVIAEGLGD